ncbi:DUF2059 domain-containing protein [Variovorax boronicumulans]|uniref:DUF2059 domain-containing protein n=1 Tax=Variovorax boronicumulans TaxID=436515 RepID=UPI0036F25ED5
MHPFLKPLGPAFLAPAILLPSGAHSAPGDRKLALATELTTLMQIRRIAEDYLSHCSKPEGSYLDPQRIFSAEPGFFGGVSPQSAYWPEVVALYARYQAQACHSVSADKYAAFFAEQYAAKLSEEELEASLAFFASTAGRRYNAVSAETNVALQAYLTKEMARVVGDAFKDVQRDLRGILLKYKNDPR